jgi:hypothetical protein
MNWTWSGYASLMKWCRAVGVVALVLEVPAIITGFVPRNPGSIFFLFLMTACLVTTEIKGRQARRHALAHDRESTGWADLVARLPIRPEV